jgi:hypothetical protein
MTKTTTLRADALTPAHIGSRLKVMALSGAVIEDVLLSMVAEHSAMAVEPAGADLLNLYLRFRNCRPSTHPLSIVAGAVAEGYFVIEPEQLVEVID